MDDHRPWCGRRWAKRRTHPGQRRRRGHRQRTCIAFGRLGSGLFLFLVPPDQLITARRTGRKTLHQATCGARADRAQKCLHTRRCGGAEGMFARRLATYGQGNRHRSTAKVSQWRAHSFVAHEINLSVHISSRKAPGPPTRTAVHRRRSPWHFAVPGCPKKGGQACAGSTNYI